MISRRRIDQVRRAGGTVDRRGVSSRHEILGATRRLGCLLCLVWSLAACVTTDPAASGTSLSGTPVVDPAVAEREAVETQLVMGGPLSLVAAVELLGTASALPADRVLVYRWLAYEMARLAYPELMGSFEPIRDVPQTDPLVKLFIEARNGRPVILPANASALEELLPALLMFRFRTSEAADQAMAALERFARFGVASSLASLVRGLALERTGENASAMVAYRQSLTLAPDNYQSQLALAALLVKASQAPEAIQLLETVDQLVKRTILYRRAYAGALYAAARYSEALPVITSVLLEEPTNSAFVLMRAHLLVEGKEYRQALPLLDAYASVNALDRLYLLLRARVALEHNRDRRNALVYLRRALERYPSDVSLMIYTANLLNTGSNSQEQAEAQLLAAAVLQLEPASREALLILLAADLRNGDFVTAAGRADSLRLMGLRPNEYELVYRAYRNAEHFELALVIAAEWREASPNAEPARIAYLTMLVDSGQKALAATILTPLLTTRGSAAYNASLHWLNSRLQTNPEAILNSLRTALVEDSMNVDALVGMYDYYADTRDYQRAAFYLRQAFAIAPNRREVLSRRTTMNQLGYVIP